MPIGSPSDAARTARRLLGLSEGDEGSANRVRRLDRPVAYYIVHTGGYVVALDEATGALLASAETPRSPVTLSHATALARAGSGAAATAELVWTPATAATQSMFDPLWAVTEAGHTRYIDQRGRLFEILPGKRPGGGR